MIEIRDIDKADGATLRRWWEVCHDAQSDRPVDYFPTWDVARVELPTPRPDFRLELFAAYDGDRMVGTGLVNLPLDDNTHLVFTDVYVDWPDRRRGVGTLLLEEVERRGREAGRKTAMVEVFRLAGETSAGLEFAKARGYAVANEEGLKALDLAESEARWEPLEVEAESKRGPYRLLSWRNTVPEEYASAFVELLGGFLAMVPLGDLELEEREWTVERLRADEVRSQEVGQDKFLSVGLAPDGTLVGCTDTRLNTANRRVAFIGITMVTPAHRGHRLGLAMKLATHRALRAAYPECELVVTSNADVNQRMNDINEAMGYRVIEQLLEVQKRL